METKQNSQFTMNDNNTKSNSQFGQSSGKLSSCKAEETKYDESPVNGEGAKTSMEAANDNPRRSRIAQVASTAGGILLGGVAGAFLSSFTADDPVKPVIDGEDTNNTNNTNNAQDTNDAPVWSDGGVAVAHGVTDDMSFSEAFAAARAEVGPGGAFEWHGNVYGTYYAEEWNAMNPDEQLAYENHFNWSEEHVDDVNTTGNNENLIAENEITETNEVEIISTTPADSEVEILGVVHDASTGYDVGGVLVDGQEVLFVDVNTDGTFDYALTDMNGDGQISENEIADISQEGLTVNELEQASLMDDNNSLAYNDGMPDYVNDADVNSLA